MTTGCPLCHIGSVPEQKVILENDHCVFLQMPQPVLIGSGLIAPKSHRETVFDQAPEEWYDTFDLLRRGKALLDEAYQPDGYNVGWNCGSVAGQHVFHAHLHFIPRFADEPLAVTCIRGSPSSNRPSAKCLKRQALRLRIRCCAA